MRLSRSTLIGSVFIIATGSSLTSCFKEEPLNAECDIEQAWVHVDDPEKIFFNVTDTLVNVPYSKNDITFYVKRKSDISAMSPMFTITDGAKIEPASGSTHDFTNGPVTYTVTSEDGGWSRTYNVEIKERISTVTDILEFDFEHYAPILNNKNNPIYYEWFDIDDENNEQHLWATGNPGYRFAVSSKEDPYIYPTVPYADGIDGTAVKLETRSTGTFGAMMAEKKLIAAGNLFYGFFNTKYAVTQSLLSTEFGHPFDKEPIRISGYYQYKPGEKYQDKNGNIIEGMTDQGTIYSVLYRNHDEEGKPVMLHGDDVLTSRYVVAVARMAQMTETNGWTEFSLDYTYYSEIDIDELNNFGYNFTIVFSSSYEGDKFEGAVGSTLLVDKVRVECRKTE